ncbi:MAG TPA: HlyD family efflux transporter periplasmic adaptor subunit [Puia sp.]|nr:HlyD family efflux transporter periplasmic adaptor subunit [Puia sp.]
MPVSSSVDELENSYFFLLHGGYRQNHFLYTFSIIIILVAVTALPFIRIDLSVRSRGMTRPANERTEIRSAISGIIDSVFYEEGSLVRKDEIVLKLRDSELKGKSKMNRFGLDQCRNFIKDLQLLTREKILNLSIVNRLVSPLYQGQAIHYIHQLAEQEALLRKANKEIEMNAYLAKEKIISPKEFFDIQVQQERVLASFKAFRQEQLSGWQQDLVRYESELSGQEEQENQLAFDAAHYEIRAPVTGYIQGMGVRYKGSLLQANEAICSISPEAEIVAECYISTRNIGFIRKNQRVQFQVDAFDYNYFGVLTGKVIAIDNDYVILDNTPVFKVRCKFDSSQLQIKRDMPYDLKKGLSFQARFIIGQRTAWQLLFDKIDNWLDPVAPDYQP